MTSTHILTKGHDIKRKKKRPEDICEECKSKIVLCWGEKITTPYWRHERTKKCEDCDKIAIYGFPKETPSLCEDHKKVGMIKCNSSGESADHKLAKTLMCDYLNSGKKAIFIYTCNECKEVDKICKRFKKYKFEKEQRYKSADGKVCIWDIVGINSRGEQKFGVEIRHSHIAENLDRRNDIQWVEVGSSEVISKLMEPLERIELKNLYIKECKKCLEIEILDREREKKLIEEKKKRERLIIEERKEDFEEMMEEKNFDLYMNAYWWNIKLDDIDDNVYEYIKEIWDDVGSKHHINQLMRLWDMEPENIPIIKESRNKHKIKIEKKIKERLEFKIFDRNEQEYDIFISNVIRGNDYITLSEYLNPYEKQVVEHIKNKCSSFLDRCNEFHSIVVRELIRIYVKWGICIGIIDFKNEAFENSASHSQKQVFKCIICEDHKKNHLQPIDWKRDDHTDSEYYLECIKNTFGAIPIDVLKKSTMMNWKIYKEKEKLEELLYKRRTKEFLKELEGGESFHYEKWNRSEIKEKYIKSLIKDRKESKTV